MPPGNSPAATGLLSMCSRRSRAVDAADAVARARLLRCSSGLNEYNSDSSGLHCMPLEFGGLHALESQTAPLKSQRTACPCNFRAAEARGSMGLFCRIYGPSQPTAGRVERHPMRPNRLIPAASARSHQNVPAEADGKAPHDFAGRSPDGIGIRSCFRKLRKTSSSWVD